MLKSAEQQKYIYFSKDMSPITFNDIEIPTPEYVFRAAKRYRFNSSEGVLEKQCSNCTTWFCVCKIEDNSFKKIHDESLIHFFGKSGFSTNCRKCGDPQPLKITNQLSAIDKDDKKNYLNIILPEHLKKYLKAKSFLEDRSVTNIVVEMLETTAKENPITISFK